jgi:(1->4)-alpha-D-glucan 1-alpha-D-glucosylmutase
LRQDDGHAALLRDLAHAPEDPRLKLLLVRQALHARRAMPEVFVEGDYAPLTATGAHADRVFAFVRRHGRQAAITIVPRLTMALLRGERQQLTGDAWGDTRVQVPDEVAALSWRSALSGRESPPDRETGDACFGLSTLFAELPLALLVGVGAG